MTTTGRALALVAEARRLGLTLRVVNGSIGYSPKDRMPADLAGRIKANRDAEIAVLLVQPADPSKTDPPPSTENRANSEHRVSVGGERLTGDSEGLPVKWRLDEMDRRVLLACGVLPTPNVDNLPRTWRQRYQVLTARLAKMPGVCLEHAEALALSTVLKEMLATGELWPEGW